MCPLFCNPPKFHPLAAFYKYKSKPFADFKMTMFAKLCTLALMALLALNALPTATAIKNCTELNALEECMRPRDTVNATGQFICRRRWQNGVGIRPRVDFQSLCIAKTWGRESDRCGCCEGECPDMCSELCPNPVAAAEGQLGVYLYDWYSFRQSRMCVTPGRAVQMQQQNGQRWRCVEYPGWLNKVLDSSWNEDGSKSYHLP